MKTVIRLQFLFLMILFYTLSGYAQIAPDQIQFVRQGVKRLIFDRNQGIPLATLKPAEIIGMTAMHPIHYYSNNHPDIYIERGTLVVKSESPTESSIWLGGFNPFATYVIDVSRFDGDGVVGMEFSNADKQVRMLVTVAIKNQIIQEAGIKVIEKEKTIADESIYTHSSPRFLSGQLIFQLYGSGLSVFTRSNGLPIVVGQTDFNQWIDLREKRYFQSFHSSLYFQLSGTKVSLNGARAELSTGLGQADIRAITSKDGKPLLDRGRLWFTMSIRGRALPHHLQGVFSMSPSAFDVKLEGVIVFDQGDGLLRNEISSHIFYDEEDQMWRGLTTGFSAFANPEKEKKQILAIESRQDPRFGFSVMKARPIGMVGDIEDSHILFDEEVGKWRMLTCENHDGYKAVILESDHWDRGYKRIAGPVQENSTGTSIQQIGEKKYCFSGSSARKIFIYSYPELQPAGTLQMDLPPWDEKSRTRVWPNVITLPDGYPAKYLALMMDRYNFPGLKGPNWTYGALYLYYGYE